MKIINLMLSVASINKAKRELEDYKRDLMRNALTLKNEISRRLKNEIEEAFSNAIIDDLVEGGARKPEVIVDINNKSKDLTVVIVSGEDAIFVEFGAGIYHNGTAGGSKHPYGKRFGFTIGDYGYGLGKLKSWKFEDQDGDYVETRGTPAQMPVLKTVEKIRDEIEKMAKEIFK